MAYQVSLGFSLVHAVLPVHVLDVGVHAADATALANGDFDEAGVAPVCAPRVLTLPVVVLALGILQASSVVLAVIRAVSPPLGDSAGFYGFRLSSRGGLRLRSLLLCFSLGCCLFLLFRFGLYLRRRRLGTFLSVSDNNEGMIQAGATLAILIKDTALVELEGFRAGINSDGHRLQSEPLLGISKGSLDLIPLFEFAENVAIVVLTILSFTSVRVVLLSHGAVVSLELPAVGHPATAAAKSLVMLSKQLLVVFGVSRTVDELLL